MRKVKIDLTVDTFRNVTRAMKWRDACAGDATRVARTMSIAE
jgi:hypothetical protein